MCPQVIHDHEKHLQLKTITKTQWAMFPQFTGIYKHPEEKLFVGIYKQPDEVTFIYILIYLLGTFRV